MDLTLTALAHPVRRAILERVMQTELRVTELAEPFDMSLNAVSKHIRMLERADLLRRRVEGRDHILTLNPQGLDETVRWINEQRAIWAWRLAELDNILKEPTDG